MKLVSIIIPIYDQCNGIEECYKSLVNQTYKNIEIIFVGNNLDFKEKFNDKRVYFINIKKNDLFEIIKVGIIQAKGEYISFVYGNDTIARDFIYKLVKSLENGNSDISVGRIGFHKCINLKSKKKSKKIDLIDKKEYLPVLISLIIGKLFKRELFDCFNNSLNSYEELSIMCLLYIKCRYISSVNDAIYYYHSSKIEEIDGYKFEYLYNTFSSLRYLYEKLEKVDKLEDYFYEMEILFIILIFRRIGIIMNSALDKIYRYRFISSMLDYLEYFFPDWEMNPYYRVGYRLGELPDRYNIKLVVKELSKIKRKRLYISLEDVYDRYKKIEEMYEKIK